MWSKTGATKFGKKILDFRAISELDRAWLSAYGMVNIQQFLLSLLPAIGDRPAPVLPPVFAAATASDSSIKSLLHAIGPAVLHCLKESVVVVSSLTF